MGVPCISLSNPNLRQRRFSLKPWMYCEVCVKTAFGTHWMVWGHAGLSGYITFSRAHVWDLGVKGALGGVWCLTSRCLGPAPRRELTWSRSDAQSSSGPCSGLSTFSLFGRLSSPKGKNWSRGTLKTASKLRVHCGLMTLLSTQNLRKLFSWGKNEKSEHEWGQDSPPCCLSVPSRWGKGTRWCWRNPLRGTASRLRQDHPVMVTGILALCHHLVSP